MLYLSKVNSIKKITTKIVIDNFRKGLQQLPGILRLLWEFHIGQLIKEMFCLL